MQQSCQPRNRYVHRDHSERANWSCHRQHPGDSYLIGTGRAGTGSIVVSTGEHASVR
jgi:hypothetical protein